MWTLTLGPVKNLHHSIREGVGHVTRDKKLYGLQRRVSIERLSRCQRQRQAVHRVNEWRNIGGLFCFGLRLARRFISQGDYCSAWLFIMDRKNKFEPQFLRPSAHVMAASAAAPPNSGSKTLKGIIAGQSVCQWNNFVVVIVFLLFLGCMHSWFLDAYTCSWQLASHVDLHSISNRYKSVSLHKHSTPFWPF